MARVNISLAIIYMISTIWLLAFSIQHSAFSRSIQQSAGWPTFAFFLLSFAFCL